MSRDAAVGRFPNYFDGYALLKPTDPVEDPSLQALGEGFAGRLIVSKSQGKVEMIVYKVLPLAVRSVSALDLLSGWPSYTALIRLPERSVIHIMMDNDVRVLLPRPNSYFAKALVRKDALDNPGLYLAIEEVCEFRVPAACTNPLS